MAVETPRILPTHPSDVANWPRRIIGWFSKREGKFDSLNRNLDGVGLSFGMLQWSQKSGNLGKLLQAMQRADPKTFARIFGPSWPTLVAQTLKGSLAPVDGAVLWAEPWASRFQAAGRHPAFIETQWRVAESGPHWQGAENIARLLNIRTERALALFMDRCNHQGPTTAYKMVEGLKARYLASGATTVPYLQVLQDVANTAANRFFRSSPPSSSSTSASYIRWRQVGGAWHAYAGQIDLYAVIVRRTGEILRTTELTDFPLPFPGQAVA